MKKNDYKKTTTRRTFLKGADPAIIYRNQIAASVYRILVSPLEVKELMHLLTGQALKAICPERNYRCDDKSPCEIGSCHYSKFIFESVLLTLHDSFEANLRSFLETQVRKMNDEIRLLVAVSIRDTADVRPKMGELRSSQPKLRLFEGYRADISGPDGKPISLWPQEFQNYAA